MAQVVEEIQKKSKKVKDTSEIAQVGTVAANGEKAIGDMIAKAMQKVGNEAFAAYLAPVAASLVGSPECKITIPTPRRSASQS